MNNRVPKIASYLKRWCAEQSGRTCEAMFARFMESVLTKTEAKRFFEAYADEPILKFYSPRMCTITVHQDHFNVDAVSEIADLIDLAEEIDPRYGKPKANKAEIPVKVADLVYNEKTGDFEASATPVECKIRSLDEILNDLEVIVHELDAMGMYLIADKDGYAIRKDFNPVIWVNPLRYVASMKRFLIETMIVLLFKKKLHSTIGWSVMDILLRKNTTVKWKKLKPENGKSYSSNWLRRLFWSKPQFDSAVGLKSNSNKDMAQKSNLTLKEFEAKLREVMDFIYDIYLPNDCYVQIMTGAPMYAAFCDKNKKSISETVILLMAFQIIGKRYGFVYWHCVDEFVEHFKKVALDYLNSK